MCNFIIYKDKKRVTVKSDSHFAYMASAKQLNFGSIRYRLLLDLGISNEEKPMEETDMQRIEKD